MGDFFASGEWDKDVSFLLIDSYGVVMVECPEVVGGWHDICSTFGPHWTLRCYYFSAADESHNGLCC
jgi:hypothetical protein